MTSVRLTTPGLDGFGEAELLDLEDRSAHILRMRSRIWDGEEHSFREIAEELGLTPERVRQIQNQGLLLIRQVREVQRHLRHEPAIRRTYRFGRRW
ncbi:MAG: sigma factor-like helix-turn-helix DNA-binding protein [Solirubrobacterales bacterium]